MSKRKKKLGPVPWTRETLVAYLQSLGHHDVSLRRQTFLKGEGEDELKAFGYGKPVLLDFEANGARHRLVLHTLSPNSFGHERRADRAESLVLAHDSFNRLPRHVASLDLGVIEKGGRMLSLGDAEEFFQITEYVPGRLYSVDLEHIRDTSRIRPRDQTRARSLALYLADIHRLKHVEPPVYHRRIRDLIGHGEGIMGLTDSYPDDFALAGPTYLEDVERRAITWRWRLRRRTHRLSQVHGDFHPFNILFDEDDSFRLLDRSRGEWGEPADDVTALSINYIFFSLLGTEGRFDGPLEELFHLFWETYLEASRDPEILVAAPPFLAWRGLVLGSPVWYPSVSETVRGKLFRLIRNVLEEPRFEPKDVTRYLED